MESKQFCNRLINWYEQNKRDLPFRNTRDPYAIWLSEIIMQQTRVAQGLSYYLKFLAAYPDIESFANAPEDEIMKLWQGLGYYSRARYMMNTAHEIAFKHKGIFPSNYSDLLKLKGIGEYTAAAIASISFNQPVAAVDANVLRVFSRFSGIRDSIDKAAVRKSIRDSLDLLIDKKKPAIFNQAMIELGAICCTPRSPDCKHCPLSSECFAAKHSLQDLLPVKNHKSAIRTRYFHYLIMNARDTYFLNKRSGRDIWKALYEFPMVETTRNESPSEFLSNPELNTITGKRKINIQDIKGPYKHQLSHQTIYAYFYRIKFMEPYKLQNNEYIQVTHEALHDYAFPRLIEKYLEENDYLD